jgi:murein DD-endopeptidase MepM/ murein hydrolase activator NlpD
MRKYSGNRQNFRLFILILFFVFASGVLYAANSQTVSPSFIFPVGCTYNTDCWITVYADNDPTPAWRDYKGGKRTYNAHTGTDIAIKNISALQRGIPVKAAASGVVIATRDGVTDVNVKEIGENAVSAYECGNRVGIDHGNGWLTDYCHMRKGSIAVKKGDHVTAGQRIGYVGMSGLTELPHMHFQEIGRAHV